MKATYFTIAGKFGTCCHHVRNVWVLGIAVVLFPGGASLADEPGYRVVLDDFPGADQVEAGDFQTGIALLENQLVDNKLPEKPGLWSTLCAAYIYAIALDKAEYACDKAVEVDARYESLNNRGVLRVYKRDFAGARADFSRVRPVQVEAYLEKLKTTNIRLVAASNFELLEQLLEKLGQAETESRSALDAAKIEDLSY